MERGEWNRSIQEMWSQFEVQEWKDVSDPIIYWEKVRSMQDFETFVEHAQDWTARALTAYQMGFAYELSVAPETYWKDPRTHIPKLSWRGQSCSNWRLDSSAQRISNKDFYDLEIRKSTKEVLIDTWQRTQECLDLMEDKLLAHARNEFGKVAESDLEILSWAQHISADHQPPERDQWATRLLDVTSDPLVALYFAAQPCPEHHGSQCEGRVIAFDDIINRTVTDKESKMQIREGIGSIWRPTYQSVYQRAQRGEFLIMGALPARYNPILEILSDFDDQKARPNSVNVNGFSLPIIARDPEIIGQLAYRLQQISVPGIHPAFAGAGLAFKRNSNAEFPPNVAQSIRISGDQKESIRRHLESRNITKELLFPDP